MFQYDSDGKDTNAGGGHIELPAEAVEKAVQQKASHPGGIENAAGMDGSSTSAPGSTVESQPRMPDLPAGNTLSHTSDG